MLIGSRVKWLNGGSRASPPACRAFDADFDGYARGLIGRIRALEKNKGDKLGSRMNSLLVAQAPVQKIWGHRELRQRQLRTLLDCARMQVGLGARTDRCWCWARKLLLAAVAYGFAVLRVCRSAEHGWAHQVLWTTLGVDDLFSPRRAGKRAALPQIVAPCEHPGLHFDREGGCGEFPARVHRDRMAFPSLKISAAVFVVDAAFAVLSWGGLHFGARVLKSEQARGVRTANEWWWWAREKRGSRC